MNFLSGTVRIPFCGTRLFSKAKVFDVKPIHTRCFSSTSCFSSPIALRQGDSITTNKLIRSKDRGELAINTPFPHSTIRAYSSFKRIITRYDDVPESYDDREGLAFRATPLSEKEAAKIFGRGVGAENGNHILRVLHGRRVAGTLPDPSLPVPLLGMNVRLTTLGLAWLRTNVPMNEDEAAGKRAQVELQAIEQEILADSERLRIYAPLKGGNLSEETHNSKSIYGRSGIDAIREAKQQEFDEQDRAEELARQNQAEEIRSNTGTELTQNVTSHVELRRAGENPRLKYYLERAAKVAPDVPPEMSAWHRLWPSGLVVLLVVGASLSFTQLYTPPNHGARWWPDMPPAAATIICLIAANAFVFLAWRFPPAFATLNKYFLCVPGYPRGLAMLGNIFSHQSITHLMVNMVMLWVTGIRLHDDIGRANFLAVYFCSGTISSFASLAFCTARGIFYTTSLGASGAIAGVIATYLWLHAGDRFKILWLPLDPQEGLLPGIAVLAFAVLVDSIGLFRTFKGRSKFDHVSHLSGYATGILGGEIIKRGVVERKRLGWERKKNMSMMDKIKQWR